MEQEFNKFEVDVNAVATFIHSQNGSLGKAIVELITNSIDAKATECSVTINKNTFIVKDDGQGFKSKDEVMLYFKTFGTPHQEGDAKFGRFRVGRGQVMQFGKMSWISNEHEMITDIDNTGYGFVYNELKDKDVKQGCVVKGELYTELDQWNLTEVLSTIKMSCSRLDIPIRLNGKIITNNKTNYVWDIDNNDFQLRWITNDSAEYHNIKIYNLGSLVKEIDYSEYGFSAEIVSKKSFKLNVSRNEISDNDPIWADIKKLLITKSNNKVEDFIHWPKRMKEKDRRSIKHQIEANIIDFEIGKKLPILKCSDGKYISILDLVNTPMKVTIAPDASEKTKQDSDAIYKQAIGIVLHYEELYFWSKEAIEDLMYFLLAYYPNNSKENYSDLYDVFDEFMAFTFMPFQGLANLIDSNNVLLENNQLTERELSAKHALTSGSKSMANCIRNICGHWEEDREIKIGTSDTADGWTNSHSFIAINRKMLKLLDKGRVGSIQLTTLLLHEYCHDSNNSDDSVHGLEFYERYHDLSSKHGKDEILTRVSNLIYKNYETQLRKRELTLPKFIEIEPVKTNRNTNQEVDNFLNRKNTLDFAFSSKGISSFSKKVINILQLQKKFVKKNLSDYVDCIVEIKYSHLESKSFINHIAKFRDETLLPQMKMEPLRSFDKIKDREERYTAIDNHLELACKKYAKRYNYCEDAVFCFIIGFNGLGNYRLIKQLIEVVMTDSHSGLLEYTIDVGETISTRGSKNYLYHDEPSIRICGHSDMVNNSGARVDHALTKIKSTLDSIKNTDERNEVIEILKREEFSASL